MKITSRFTVAVHTLLAINTFNDEYKTTSDFIAASVNVNPVVIRRVLGQLKDAGMIAVARGTGGVQIIKPLEEITLYDVYKAVDSVEEGNLFHFHESPNPNCPVGKNIHAVLDKHLETAQCALEQSLKQTHLVDLVTVLDKKI